MSINRIAVVGGGASGLAAAITAVRMKQQVVLFEKNDQTGRKLLSTGNGRCNLSNLDAEGAETVRGFFDSLGILFREEDGRLYPHSEQARSIRDILEKEARDLGVEIRLNKPVEDVNYSDYTFYITSENGSRICEFDAVILANGGKAAPQLGADDSGFRFLRDLGCEPVSVLPALVPFVYTPEEKERLGFLKGVRAKAAVKLYEGENMIAEDRGEVQFTESGISGICVLDLSSNIRDLDKENISILIDFAPDYSVDDIKSAMEKGHGAAGLVNEKITTLISTAEELKSFRIKVGGTKGWKEAQVTSGGIPVSDIDPDTMESKDVPGLFIIGELIDIDLPCGGFNLNHAWLSGMKAGESAGNFGA